MSEHPRSEAQSLERHDAGRFRLCQEVVHHPHVDVFAHGRPAPAASGQSSVRSADGRPADQKAGQKVFRLYRDSSTSPRDLDIRQSDHAPRPLQRPSPLAPRRIHPT